MQDGSPKPSTETPGSSHRQDAEKVIKKKITLQPPSFPFVCSALWLPHSWPKHNLLLLQACTEVSCSPRSLSLALMQIFISTHVKQC